MPFSRYLIERLRSRPRAEQAVIMRQVEILKTFTRTSVNTPGIGQAGALELLLKLGSYLNGGKP